MVIYSWWNRSASGLTTGLRMESNFNNGKKDWYFSIVCGKIEPDWLFVCIRTLTSVISPAGRSSISAFRLHALIT